MNKNRFISFLKLYCLFFVIVIFITLVDFFYLGKPLTGIDDANIFFTYARHFSNGEGFVYNTGGERVEGFTSMLWVLICAAFFCVSAHPETLLMVLALLTTTLTVTLVYKEVSKDVKQLNEPFYKSYFLFLFVIFIVCIGPVLFMWSVLSLMEIALWNFIFTFLTIILLQYSKEDVSALKKVTACLFGALLMLTRPEAYAWNVLFFILFTIIATKDKRKFRFPFIYLLTFVVTFCLLLIFRLQYFGFPFTNTYYAKVSPDKLYTFRKALYI